MMRDAGWKPVAGLPDDRKRRLDTSRLGMVLAQAREQLTQRVSPAQAGLGEDARLARCKRLSPNAAVDGHAGTPCGPGSSATQRRGSPRLAPVSNRSVILFPEGNSRSRRHAHPLFPAGIPIRSSCSANWKTDSTVAESAGEAGSATG